MKKQLQVVQPDVQEAEVVESKPLDNNEKALAVFEKASLGNLAKNKATYNELAKKYADVTITGQDDKAGYKLALAAKSALTKARTTVNNLVKADKDVLNTMKKKIEAAGAELIAIVSPGEEKAKKLVEDYEAEKERIKQEEIRKAEEKKQVRIALLHEIGLTFNGSHYRIREASITLEEISKLGDENFDLFVDKCRKEADIIEQEEFEAEQARLNEEARQKKERDDLVAERTSSRQKELVSMGFGSVTYQEGVEGNYERGDDVVPISDVKSLTREQWDELIVALNTPKKEPEQLAGNYTQEPESDTSKRYDVSGFRGSGGSFSGTATQMGAPKDEPIITRDDIEICIGFNSDKIFIDQKLGKATLRLFPAAYWTEAVDGVDNKNIIDEGVINGTELNYLLIKVG